MRSILKIIVLVTVAWLPIPAFAGGTVDLVDIQSLLNQQPKIWRFYLNHFDISPHGGGLRLGAEGIPLRGYRVAPYEFPAKMKGEKGPYDLKIKIYADINFLDAQGKETSDEMKAVAIKETLRYVAVGRLDYVDQ